MTLAQLQEKVNELVKQAAESGALPQRVQVVVQSSSSSGPPDKLQFGSLITAEDSRELEQLDIYEGQVYVSFTTNFY